MYKEFIAAKNDFLFAARRTYESGIQTGTGGNLSVRLPGEDAMLVKPSGFTYGGCDEANLVITDFDGKVLEGSLKPTKESTLHGNLYRRYKEIGGIVHTHSPYSIMCSLKYDEIEAVTMHCRLKLNMNIPVVDVVTQSVTEEEMVKVCEVIDSNPGIQAFILKGHGIVALGATAAKAGQTAELIEETAKIYWEMKK